MSVTSEGAGHEWGFLFQTAEAAVSSSGAGSTGRYPGDGEQPIKTRPCGRHQTTGGSKD